MESFRIQSIKSFRDSGEVEIKPITVFVGQNSCGKSSLLRFPAVLSQTANYAGDNPPISLFGENVDYGNFEDVVFGKVGKEFSFSVAYSFNINWMPYSIKRRYGVETADTRDVQKVEMSVTLARVNKKIKVHKVSFQIEEKLISSLIWNGQEYELNLVNLKDKDDFILFDRTVIFQEKEVSFEKFFPVYQNVTGAIIRTFDCEVSKEIIDDLEMRTIQAKRYSEISEDEQIVLATYKAFMFAESIAMRFHQAYDFECKRCISYIGPFRQNPGRIYRNSETTKSHVGAKGENVGDILVNAYQQRNKSSLFDDISEWLKLDFGYNLKINELGGNYFQIMLTDDFGIESNIIDVGFGISQVLPIVAETYLLGTTNPTAVDRFGTCNLLLIEQPELHLHPAAQASLANLFSKCVCSNSSTKMIIETHSEHLIRKLQVLIASKDSPLTSDMVKIYYVDKKQNGEAKIEEMKIKPNGKFETQWPSGFFDKGFQLSMELTSALK